MDILHELPTDLQETVYGMYCDKFYEKNYVVECLLGIRTITNWQGASAWHNDDPGDDEFDYYQVPLFQLVYNEWTKDWYQPGKICNITLPDHTGYMIDHTGWDNYLTGIYYNKAEFTYVGESKIRFDKVESIMKRKVTNSSKYHKLVHSLEKHNEAGHYREYHKEQTHKYITSWYTMHQLVFRVREMVDSPPEKKDVWAKRCPKQWDIDYPSQFMPYDFYTKHMYSEVISASDSLYVWKEFLDMLKNKSMKETVDNMNNIIVNAKNQSNRNLLHHKHKHENIFMLLDNEDV